MMRRWTFCSESEADTDRLGRALAECLPPGAVAALCGELGAGKTRLVQAVAAALGAPRSEVVSPTFVLRRQYAGRRAVHHFDAYRIRDEDEFFDLGPEEAYESDGLTWIEWADRVPGCLPPERLDVVIQVEGPQRRRITLIARGAAYERALAAAARRLTE